MLEIKIQIPEVKGDPLDPHNVTRVDVTEGEQTIQILLTDKFDFTTVKGISDATALIRYVLDHMLNAFKDMKDKKDNSKED